MSTEQYRRFDGRVFIVRYFENETDCNNELQSPDLVEMLARTAIPDADVLRELCRCNGGAPTDDPLDLIRNGTLAFAFVIAGQGPQAFGMPEMFAPSQYLRHHGVLEHTSILMTDGRYSGVTKGACVGHITPEAWNGGGIGLLQHGDLLWAQLEQKRIDWLDTDAFRLGRLQARESLPQAERQSQTELRHARMVKRRRQIAACSLLDHVSDAEQGVVPESVNERATLAWPQI